MWLLTVLWFAAGAWWYSHSSCASCNAETATATAVAPVASANSCPSFAFNDGRFSQTNADNFRFVKSTDALVVSTVMNTALDEIAKHATAQNPSRLLTITGQYSNTEINQSAFDNLGLARANAIKKILLTKGIDESNVTTKAMVNDDLCYNATSDTLTGAVLLSMAQTETQVAVADTTTAAPPAPLFEPRTVYFTTGKNELNITKELDDYLVKANAYLAVNKDKKLLVSGHTDNVGNATKNVKLSADRAAFVKTILKKRGIPAAQITTEGKGMQVPIADNTTADGRAKNRRVTIVLQ